MRALALLLVIAAICSACGSHARFQPFRELHDGEAVFVQLSEQGRVHERQLADGRKLTALAATIFVQHGRQLTWAQLAEPGIKVIADGRIRPVTSHARSDRRVFLLPRDDQLAAIDRSMSDSEATTVDDELERAELAFLGGLNEDVDLVEAIIVCLPRIGGESRTCLQPSHGYTLIIGDQWSNAAAFPFNVGRRSRWVSAGAGAAFLFLIYFLTVG